MCLKAFQVPPSIRTGLTAMLPTYMRTGALPSGPLSQVNPLRMTSNTALGQTMFNALSNTEENKLFVPLKPAKKHSEEIDKVAEVSAKQYESNAHVCLNNK